MTELEKLIINNSSLSFREKNIMLFEEYAKAQSQIEIVYKKGSAPLLIPSSEEYFEKMQGNYKVMYIGQENYGWLNHFDKYNLQDVEKRYIDRIDYIKNTSNSLTMFWDFYKCATGDIDMQNILWTNAYLGGDKYDNKPFDKRYLIEDISVYNLISIYEEFKPDCIIAVCGPGEEYRKVLKRFLNHININLGVAKPTLYEPLQVCMERNFYYTYHPQFLGRYANGYNNTLYQINNGIQKNKIKI